MSFSTLQVETCTLWSASIQKILEFKITGSTKKKTYIEAAKSNDSNTYRQHVSNSELGGRLWPSRAHGILRTIVVIHSASFF